MNFDQTHNYTINKLNSKDDYEGRVEATLISRLTADESKKAILFVHGFVDYFFHNEFADWANSIGLNFYAVDLRKYGRSLLPHQKPNNFKHYEEYFEDFDLAIDYIKGVDKNDDLILYGHSTGGLLTALYANHHRESKLINKLILNSPFFDFNISFISKKLIPFISNIGKIFPNISSPEKLKTGYASSIHSDFKGEWNFNLDWKPIEGFGLNFGWINAIHTAQKELKKGLEIKCPVLVMYSSKSITPGDYSEDMHFADSVLNVEHIAKYAKVIGPDVIEVKIEDGLHDLLLSRKDVRIKVYSIMTKFLKSV
jgi:alpha-beta hydrolase superfamily lysophospholipase